MKGKITIEFTAKEAVALISSEATSKALTNKIVKAFRDAAVTPVGAKASVVAQGKARAKKTKTVTANSKSTETSSSLQN